MRSSRYFALFSLTLFFSLFSVASLLLQTTSTNLLEVVSESHFLARLLIVALALMPFMFKARLSFLENTKFLMVLLFVSYFISLVSIFFVRDGNPRFYKEVISPGLLLASSDVLFLTSVIDKECITIEDTVLYSLVLSSSCLMLFLLTDYAFFFITVMVLLLLAFSYSFSFGLRVFLISTLVLFISILSFFLNPNFTQTYIEGLSVNKAFMGFFEKTEVALSASSSPLLFFEYSTGEIIFSLLYRFKVYGTLFFALLLMVMVVLTFSVASQEEKLGEVKASRRSFAIALLFAFMVVFPLLSLATSLPVFKCDLPFITPSNLNVFVEVALMYYVLLPLKQAQ